METSTTIRRMMANNKITVPSYQRAYSWDTPNAEQRRPRYRKPTHTDVFLSDLEEHLNSKTQERYYFGHFLFKQRTDDDFDVIDGQQRLTTIVIFLCALYANLTEQRPWDEPDTQCYEDMIKRGGAIRFSTVAYDNQLFIDYVIHRTAGNPPPVVETESQRRLVRAFDYFRTQLSDKSAASLTKLRELVGAAGCTTHIVRNESQAIQMFIFQNNRGKQPSSLEIVKAQFMHNVTLHGGTEVDALIAEIQNRFATIYRSISSIEYHIDEDDILLYTQRVHFNSLWETNSRAKIDERLSKDDSVRFVQDFTRGLSTIFQNLSDFYGRDQTTSLAIHSLIALGGIAIALPFIIKAYKYHLARDRVELLCSALESLLLRHRLVGTRAEITSRINDVFVDFNNDKNMDPIIQRIEYLRRVESSEFFWAYWADPHFEAAVKGELNNPSIAKFLLWKYEVHLTEQGDLDYPPPRFDDYRDMELEHIAPKTEPRGPDHGYGDYDEEFRNQYLDCLGNYLLLPKRHNCVLGNRPFAEKVRTYRYTESQREIADMVLQGTGKWGKEAIKRRHDKIVRFILRTF